VKSRQQFIINVVMFSVMVEFAFRVGYIW